MLPQMLRQNTAAVPLGWNRLFRAHAFTNNKNMDVTKNTGHNQGPVAKKIEEQTAKLPLDVLL